MQAVVEKNGITRTVIVKGLRQSSSGSVLLMALITCAILYLVAATLLLLTMTETQIADFETRSTQALYAAESSVTLGLAELRQAHNYRATTSYPMLVDGHPALLTVSFKPRVFDNITALYHLTLQGAGAITGPQVATVRQVEQEYVIKPFALFAQEALTIGDHCRITGNVHGNGPVIVGTKSRVEGNVSSAISVATTDAAIAVNTLVSVGQISAHEPAIIFPALDWSHYGLKYWFQGEERTADPLTFDTIALTADGEDQPPEPTIIVYSGLPTPDNLARIFYLTKPLQGPLTAIDLDGTLVIPPNFEASSLSMTGPIRITPVAGLPAIISAKNLDLTLMNGAALKKYASSLKNTRITGLVYSAGDVTLYGQDTAGEVVLGGVMGRTVQVGAELNLHITYDQALLATPPPGIDFLEPGAWREPFAP